MISSQDAPCLSHCKVKLIETLSLPATYTIATWLACHSLCNTSCRHCQHMLQQLQHSKVRCYILAQSAQTVLCAPQANPQEPSRVYAPAMLPMCARLRLSSHHVCRGHSHLSVHQSWNTMSQLFITSDARSASAGKGDAVQAEFAKAGIPAEVTQKVLKQYKHYLNWDIETKLRPALQSWLQELGSQQLSQQLQKVRCLLVRTPKERNEVYSWLESKGVNAARVHQKAPKAMTRELRAVQSTFEALQQTAAFSDAQMCTLLHRHSVALEYGPERVIGTLHVVSSMLGMPMTSDSFRDMIFAASPRLFLQSPDTLHQRVAFFCQMYATGTHVARTAFTTGVFTTPEPVMQCRAAKLQEHLGWDNAQLKQKLSAFPIILNSEPSTVAHNVQDMQGAGFSPTQVWAMCTKQPSLLGRKWTSDTNVEKLQFLTCLLDLTLDNIATNPILLMCSVERHLGPRVWFLLQSGAIDSPNNIMTSGSFSWISGGSKAGFSMKFSSPARNPSMVFDTAFIDHWKQRWMFLRQHMKLSVETIAAQQELLLTSLPDRLAPRWQLLSRIASEQADFKAEDHLAALAILSDQDFAQAFRADGELQHYTYVNSRHMHIPVSLTFCIVDSNCIS